MSACELSSAGTNLTAMSAHSDDEVAASIDVTSGVSMFDGKPFCMISLDGKPIGQLDPEEVRTMAMNWLAAAEAAESDAVVVAELRGIGLEDNAVGAFLQALRSRRAE